MRKPDALQGSLDVLVLKILSRRPRLHGYALMSAITDLSDDALRVEEGSLYPARTGSSGALDSCGMDHEGHWAPCARL
jgi:hypothetical protein